MNSDFIELAKVFNKKAFDIVLQGDFSYVRELNRAYFKNENVTVGQFYENSYKLLLKNYKNEYIYKNTIAQKIVIGKHRLSNITFFNEFKVWSNFVDALVINGCITAYEIKTEYDSYSRLAKQLTTYTQVFEYVNLVIPEKKYTDSLLKILPENIGIIFLSDRNTLIEKRTAKSNLYNLSHEMIFSCLHKTEYENFLIKKNGTLPDVKPVYVRSVCLENFKKIDIIEINQFFHTTLKQRKPLSFYKKHFETIPKALSGIVLDSELKSVEKILNIVNTQLY